MDGAPFEGRTYDRLRAYVARDSAADHRHRVVPGRANREDASGSPNITLQILPLLRACARAWRSAVSSVGKVTCAG